jgi:hypothetical protein
MLIGTKRPITVLTGIHEMIVNDAAGRPLAFDVTHRLGGGAADHLGVAVGRVATLPGKLSTTHR